MAFREALDRGDVVVALVRHGQTAWNAEQRFLGRSDVPLDAVGLGQAAELARLLEPVRFDVVYTSPLARAVQTATPLASPREPVPVHLLQELSQGDLEGLLGHEAFQRYPGFFAAWMEDPTHARVPGGETLAECRDRAMEALSWIHARHRTGPALVAAVTHQMVIAAIACSVLGKPLRAWRDHRAANASVTLLTNDGHGWSVAAEGWRPPAGGSPTPPV